MKRFMFLAYLSILFSSPSYSQTCENILSPAACKIQLGCTYDETIDVCVDGPQQCSIGYVAAGNGCTKISCGIVDGTERLYLDKWDVVLDRARPCYMGTGAIKNCNAQGQVVESVYAIPALPGPRRCEVFN